MVGVFFLGTGDTTPFPNNSAYLTVSATLNDSLVNEIIAYNARDVIVQELHPIEKTLFRVDFEDVAHKVSFTNYPNVFSPDFTNPFKFIARPSKFAISLKTIVTSNERYKNFVVSDIRREDDNVEGNFVNTRAKEINSPRLLTGIYSGDDFIRVKNQFLETAV